MPAAPQPRQNEDPTSSQARSRAHAGSRSDGGGFSAAQLLLQIYGALVYYGSLLFIGIAGIIYSLLSLLPMLLLPRRTRHRLGGHLLSWIFRFFVGALRLTGVVRVDCKQLDQLKQPGGLLIAPNHPCLIDAIFVISRLPDVVCVMKSAILRNPVLGGGARLAGYIANDSPSSLVKNSIRALKEGRKLLLFPEGTRTVRPPVNQFGRSFAVIAKGAGVPVRLVFVETNTPALGKGWPILKLPRFPLRYRVTLGEEVEVPDGEDLKIWVSVVEAVFRAELDGKVVVPKRSAD